MGFIEILTRQHLSDQLIRFLEKEILRKLENSRNVNRSKSVGPSSLLYNFFYYKKIWCCYFLPILCYKLQKHLESTKIPHTLYPIYEFSINIPKCTLVQQRISGQLLWQKRTSDLRGHQYPRVKKSWGTRWPHANVTTEAAAGVENETNLSNWLTYM